MKKDCWDREVFYHLTHSTGPPVIALLGKGKCKSLRGTIFILFLLDSIGLEMTAGKILLKLISCD